MNIIIGHTNMDLDCIGSMVLARRLNPGYVAVRSRLIHPVAQNLYNIYQPVIDFRQIEEVKSGPVENVIVVDTRSMGRVKEFASLIGARTGTVTIYDHHPADSADIPGATVCGNSFGANTTFFGIELIRRGVVLGPDEATIALAGIYADTGNFTHESVTAEDFMAASFLMDQKASLAVVARVLKSLKEEHQMSLFQQILNEMVYQDFQGNLVGLSYVVMDRQAGGLAAVVEKIFDVEDVDALFTVFNFKDEKSVLIIARSRHDRIAVNDLMRRFGGGGHERASSALVKGRTGGEVFREFIGHIDSSLAPAAVASGLMTRDVPVVSQGWTLLEASMFLESSNFTGAPVVDENGALSGIITLRDIMKGRKASQMHAPVKAYMTKKLITGTVCTTVRELEDIFFKKGIGLIPIIEDGRIVGIITRNDYLNHIYPDRAGHTQGTG
ncbi:MAG TPA: CBS domain-containing protein [Spirochaetota bacterium]|nr:CBS domain-containing protein [Spirochaetota bacterium]